MLVLGGFDSSGHAQRDAWELDLNTGAWREVATSGEAPGARLAHSAVALDAGADTDTPRVLVVGGYDGVCNGNDVYALDVDSGVWSLVVGKSSASAAGDGVSVLDDAQGNARGDAPGSAQLHATLAQQLRQPSARLCEEGELLPRRKNLHVKCTRRCRACMLANPLRNIVIKPNMKPDQGELILFTVTFCANPANNLTCPPHLF